MTGFPLANVLRSKTDVPAKKRRTIFQGSYKLALELGLARNYEIRVVQRFFAAHHKSSYIVIFDNKTSDGTTHCRTFTLLFSAVCNATFLFLFFRHANPYRTKVI